MKAGPTTMLPPLHIRSCKNELQDIERMRSVLNESPELLEQHLSVTSPWRGNSLLPLLIYDIISSQHTNCLSFILDVGKDKISTEVINEAFLFAKRNSNDSDISLNMMEQLLQCGAYPNNKSEDVLSTDWLFLAIDNGYLNEFQLLLEYGAETEDQELQSDGTLQRLYEGRTSPLTHAISHCNSKAIKLLLLHKASKTVFFEYWMHGYVEYSIPHFVLYNYFESNDALDVLKIYNQFGGSLWSTDSFGYPYTNMLTAFPDEQIVDETALDAIRNRPALQHHRDIIDPLEELMCNPLSLLSLSRLVLHQTMGRQYWCHINRLDIPKELKEYLHFNVPPRRKL